MKILLTGASGYVGSAALRSAHSRGHDVVILSRPGTANGSHPSLNIDLTELDKLEQAASGFDAVIHCAASDNPDFWPISGAAALAMIYGLRPHGAFASHAGSIIFGDTGASAVEPTTFSAPPPLVARAELDQAILEAGRDRVRTYVVYGSLIYGADKGAVIPSLLLNVARKARASFYVDDGRQYWSSAHVDDFGGLLVNAVEGGPSGGHALFAAGIPYTLKSVAEMISQLTSFPLRSLTPEHASDMFGMFADALAINQHFSSTKARNECHWSPRQSDDPNALLAALKALASATLQ